MFHLLNHEFNNEKPQEEKASDLLAGGINQKGHQCGLLWGASLAVGAESYKRYKDSNEAVYAAIIASQHILQSFEKRTKTVNCRDIAKVDWENRLQFIIYMIRTILHGFVYSDCFNLMVKWTPEAYKAAEEGLSSMTIQNTKCVSCASEVVKKMGGNEEETIMAAGFAGGIGLSGNACGALSAAIWYKMLKTIQTEKEKKITMFNNPDAKKILRIFYKQTDSEILCRNICGKTFLTPQEHTEYIEMGGCASIIKALSEI
jgi:ribosomal protein S27E